MSKILVVCGNGLGSSLILKMKVQSVLKELNNTDVEVEHCDLTTAESERADLIVVVKDLASHFEGKRPYITVTNIMNTDELRTKLRSFIEKA
jgi:PTS system ascorbate-specific IIB component